ncbi:outer membrane protein assembly factor BamB family protein [Streptomyces sp. 6N223]|uniref:outer membrane protein assembly factor BamB family protein n=1 Tax=Streptomyces sp. 6N223 TaxID=3457412 RepID=UPI003FD2CFAE
MSQPPHQPPHQPPPSSPYPPQGQPQGQGRPYGQPLDQRPTAPPSGGFGPPAPPGPPPPAGQPLQPTQPGGFGPPNAAPPPPAASPPTGPRHPGGRGRARTLIALATGFGLVAVGASIALLTGFDRFQGSGSDPSPEPGPTGQEQEADGLPTEPVDASLAWEAGPPEVTPEEITDESRGVWVSGENVVRTVDDAITAYDLRTGEEAWSLPLELTEGQCRASENVSEDRIAVLQGRDCEIMTVIDIASGDEVTSFPTDVGGSGGGAGSGGVPSILGDIAAVSWSYGLIEYNVGTGEPIWASDITGECQDIARTVIDHTFITHEECASGDAGGSIRATTEDGSELWRWEYDGGFEGEQMYVKSVISIDPLIVTAHADDDYEQERILLIDERHESIEFAFDYDPEHYVSPCHGSTLTDCGLAVVDDRYLYLSSYTGQENAIVAFDLGDGHAVLEIPPYYADRDEGAREAGDLASTIRPFAVVDGQLLGYQRDAFDENYPGTVVSIDPEAEKATPVMHLEGAASPKEYLVTAGATSPWDSQVIWHENTLLLVRMYFSEDDNAAGEPSLLAYH